MRLLSLTALIVIAAAPTYARASCIAPDAVLKWSYPAQGATDIPTDADLFISHYSVKVARADGTMLQPVAPGSMQYDLGILAPNTDHVLHLTLEGSDPETRERTEREEVLRFRTGDGPATASAPGAVTIREHAVTRRRDRDEAALDRCLELTASCYDTVQDTYVTFTPEAPTKPLLWMVEPVSAPHAPVPSAVGGSMFPGTCSMPWLFLHAGEERDLCVRVHAIEVTGARSTSQIYCVSGEALPADGGVHDDATPDAGLDAGSKSSEKAVLSGCHVGGSTTSASRDLALVLLLAGLALRRRHRRDAERLRAASRT